MIEGTGYNVVIGFCDKKTAIELKDELLKKYGFAINIVKMETVKY